MIALIRLCVRRTSQVTPSGISGESSSEISVFAQYKCGCVTLNEHHFGLFRDGDDAQSDSDTSLDASLRELQSPYIKYFPADYGWLPPPTNYPKTRSRARCEHRLLHCRSFRMGAALFRPNLFKEILAEFSHYPWKLKTLTTPSSQIWHPHGPLAPHEALVQNE